MAAPRTETTVRIENLHPSVTKDYLYKLFVPFGEIVEVEYTQDADDGDAPFDPDTALVQAQRYELAHGKDLSKRVAHVQFEEPMDAAAALDNMDKAEVYGHVLRVMPARAMRDAEEVLQGLSEDVPVWQQESFIQHQQRKQNGDDAMAGLEVEAKMNDALPSAPVGPLPAGE